MRFWFRNWTVSGSRVPLKPGADCHFAAGLEDAGGGTETLGAKFRIAHASAIVKDVQCAFGRLGTGSRVSTEGVDDVV